ncbi:DUF732 domain-containing protein [Mycobacterium sp. OAE908]|uniref:DUF732 domain-containing protein n=1 Tax=Mycobacterium sp. OAE908 TaxID=2817899 RepID=UPI001AE160B5
MRLTSGIVCVAFSATWALITPLAHADPGSDFLSRLHAYGIDISAIMGHPISSQDTIELGQALCTELHQGTSAPVETEKLYRQMRRITDKQAGNLVSAAQFSICPDTL